ncbi:MAG: hypothetical protein RLZZ241_1420 [Bacteroidota bacterium]|jgi:hypothetical protein
MHKLIGFWKLHWIAALFTIGSLICYTEFAYDLNRSDSLKLIGLLAALSLFFIKIIQFEKLNFTFLAIVGILFRLVFLLATPNLSPDYFRFLWDGNLVLLGHNPYISTPLEWSAQTQGLFPAAQELLSGMSELNAQHYSNYPPINQYFFALAVLVGGKTVIGGVIGIRLLLLLADLGILYLGKKLLQRYAKSTHLIFWYFLNPMIIIELIGNLHFEGLMLLFLVLSLFLIHRGQWWFGALFMALSIGTKLIPLMLLPLILPLLGFYRTAGFYAVLGVCLIGFSYPLLHSDGVIHFLDTVRLWFSNFEFNAGIYNIAEGIANALGVKSWKFIRLYGAVTPWITLVGALLLTLHPKMREPRNWMNGALGVFTIYYLLAAVLHPWYLSVPLFLSLFTPWRFMLWWAVLGMLSYTAYEDPYVHEKSLWLLIEYIAVFGILVYEIFKLKRHIVVHPKKFSI